jgi:RHS repeat-associated protein
LTAVHLWLRASGRAVAPDPYVRHLLDNATADHHPVTRISYDARGQRLAIDYSNGAVSRCTYDRDTFRLATLTTTRPAAPAVQALSYAYDAVGNITSIADATQNDVHFQNAVVSASSHYEYDALYQLILAEGREHIGLTTAPETTWDDAPRTGHPHRNDGRVMRRYTEVYAYDKAGNLTSLTHKLGNAPGGATLWTRTFEPAADGNRLLRSTVGGRVEQYQYDGGTQRRGNMSTVPPLQRLTWNFKNQLRSVDLQGGGVAYYTYDASGQRIRKVVARRGGVVQERIYIGGWEVYRERSGTVPTLERETLHVMDDQRRIAMVETRTRPSGARSRFRFQLDNHLGSSVVELGEAAEVIGLEEYYPYGGTSYASVPARVEVSARRYRYSGKERDEETGLYYYGARYYASWLGRWISPDPIGLRDGLNLYQFVHGRPLSRKDPRGTSTQKTTVVVPEEEAPVIQGRPGNDLRSAGEAIREAEKAGDETAAKELRKERAGNLSAQIKEHQRLWVGMLAVQWLPPLIGGVAGGLAFGAAVAGGWSAGGAALLDAFVASGVGVTVEQGVRGAFGFELKSPGDVIAAVIFGVAFAGVGIGLKKAFQRWVSGSLSASEAARSRANMAAIRAKLPANRKLSDEEMRAFIEQTYQQNELLQQLTAAQNLKGQAKDVEMLRILHEFEMQTGTQVKIVTASQMPGDNKASIRTEPGYFLIRDDVFQNSDDLWTELQHGMATYYLGGNLSVMPMGALNRLDAMIAAGHWMTL